MQMEKTKARERSEEKINEGTEPEVVRDKEAKTTGKSEDAASPYRFVLLDDTQRQQIIKAVRPGRRLAFSCDNLNLTYGVRSEKSGFVMVLIYYMSDAIKRCDEPDDYRFILLYPHGTRTIDCQQGRGNAELTLCSRVDAAEKTEIQGALTFYEKDPSRHELLREAFGEERAFSSYYQQNQEYIRKLVLDPEQRELDLEKEAQNNKKAENIAQQTRKEDRAAKRDVKLKKVFCVILGCMGLLVLISYFVMPGQPVSRLVASILCILICVLSFFTQGE